MYPAKFGGRSSVKGEQGFSRSVLNLRGKTLLLTMNSFALSFASGIVWSLTLFLTAIPWLIAIDPRSFKAAVRRPANWGIALVVCIALAALLAFFVGVVKDPGRLRLWGKGFGAVVELQ